MNYKKLAKKYIFVQKLSKRIIPRPSFISQHGKPFLSQFIGYSSMLLNKLATVFEIFKQQVTVRFLLMRNYLQTWQQMCASSTVLPTDQSTVPWTSPNSNCASYTNATNLMRASILRNFWKSGIFIQIS